MGSGSSAAKGGRAGRAMRSAGRAPRSRSASPGGSSAPWEEPPPRGDEEQPWPQGGGSPPTTRPSSGSARPAEGEEEDTDGELDRALEESQDVYELQRRQGSRSPLSSTGAKTPSSSPPPRIPSLELEGPTASPAQGWTLREAEALDWPSEERSTTCEPDGRGESPELLKENAQDLENNNIPNKFHTKSKMISDSQGPILYDVSEEELMASIEREF